MSKIIVDSKQLSCNVEGIKNRINVDKFFYAMKANSDPIVLKELYSMGCNFEVASLNEYNKAIQVGAKPENIICGLPVKPIDFLKSIENSKIGYLIFDNINEYNKLRQYSNDIKKIMRIYVSDIDKESHPWGMKIEELEKMKSNTDFFESIDGISFHISRNFQIKKMQKVFDRIEYIVDHFFVDREMIINIGGGIRDKLPPHLAMKYDLDLFYESINNRIEELRRYRNVVVYCEPGRGIVETACHIITNV